MCIRPDRRADDKEIELEMIKIDKHGIVSYRIPVFEPEVKPAHCVFEFIYFSRPDSFVFGSNVDKVRRNSVVNWQLNIP